MGFDGNRNGPSNGITATGDILLSYPRAKVVIVSKYDDHQTQEAARQAGACGTF